MTLADEYAKAWHASQTSRLIAAYDDGVHRKALRTALEAALKPVEPVAWAEAEAIAIRPSVEDAIEALLADQTLDNATGVVMAVLNAAPPAQTPPPRLKGTAVEACIKAVEDAFAWTGGHGEPSKPGPDAIANIIRSHFHVAQTPPPRLTDDELVNIFRSVHPRERLDHGKAFARDIETAVRTQFGVNT
jgi:hypothetical protein